MPSTVKRLVIVESPAKAKTISGYLGPGYVVEASFGHVRDLPRNAADVPAKYKGEPWARLGVDVDHGFNALYVVSSDRKQQIAKLTKLAKEVDEIFLATDEDREGEAIAWHLLETIKPKVPVKRMVFHEITKGAIQAAVANPREIDRALVDAQEARRILDRLYGYEVSPVLWKKVGRGTSAGRVQSVATRIVVEREKQRMAFRSANYWDISATLATLRAGSGRRCGLDGRASRARSTRRWLPSTVIGSPPARTSSRRPVPPAAPSCTSTSRVRGASPLGCTASRSRSTGSRRSRTGAGRTHRSSPPRCSRRVPASSGSRRRRRCALRSDSTRTATSPTCVRTR